MPAAGRQPQRQRQRQQLVSCGTALCDAVGRCRPWSTSRSTPRVDAFRDIRFPMEIHPRMAWIYRSPGTCRRRGGVGLRGIRAMDGAAEPTGTYLRRPRNPTPHRPASICRCCSGCCFGC
ncbi:hypothetical protein TEP_07920 [Stenotrophomonas sp. TEPEL]|nr:hypothetical protein TEP_07920 [Stenotrophomonas sp. TEPEL]